MKKLYKYILLVLVTTFFCCQEKIELDGNYAFCHNGQYYEVYFKKDSMRSASNTSWENLSEWRKIEFKNDTLYFETFGRSRDSSKALIKFIRFKKIEMTIAKSKQTLYLETINRNINWEDPKDFWLGYKARKRLNCEID